MLDISNGQIVREEAGFPAGRWRCPPRGTGPSQRGRPAKLDGLRRSVVGLLSLALFAALSTHLDAQTASYEYQVKAAYLLNFLKFVEFPQAAGPINICVAGRNPFGTTLDETVRGEQIQGRPVIARVILEPEPNCDMIFVPIGAATTAYLRAARDTSTLTVGETDQFIMQGGIVNFVRRGNNIRFEIDPAAAEQAKLRISSRLLQLATIVHTGGPR